VSKCVGARSVADYLAWGSSDDRKTQVDSAVISRVEKVLTMDYLRTVVQKM